MAKHRVSLTAPNCENFARVSLRVLDFWTQLPKLKNLIHKSKAQNLGQDSLTRRLFLALAMAVNLFLSNLTLLPLPKLNKLFVSETCMDTFSNLRIKVAN